MFNMVDIGGHLGRVSISAFKQNKKRMRIVVVEPVPVTYFLLRWNLWLNGIPELTRSEFKTHPRRAGVLALNNGVAKADGKKVGMCYQPPFTMRAMICNCSAQEVSPEKINQGWVNHCFRVVGHTMDYFLDVFGDDPIGFLKLDCEGCEVDAVPQLRTRSRMSGQQIQRFAGELHEQRNGIEDFACKFDKGKWFKHVCFLEKGWFKTVWLVDRCKEGHRRHDCVRP